jgi:hypothetical protein
MREFIAAKNFAPVIRTVGGLRMKYGSDTYPHPVEDNPWKTIRISHQPPAP